VGNDKQWAALTTLPGFESLAEEKYQRNAGRIADVNQLNERIANCTLQLMTGNLITALTSIGVPVAQVNSLREVLAEPLLHNAFARLTDPRTQAEIVLPPLANVADTDADNLKFPPRLGEHNTAIYGGELGFDETKLAALKMSGVI
jgi:formyl-CoA transferase